MNIAALSDHLVTKDKYAKDRNKTSIGCIVFRLPRPSLNKVKIDSRKASYSTLSFAGVKLQICIVLASLACLRVKKLTRSPLLKRIAKFVGCLCLDFCNGIAEIIKNCGQCLLLLNDSDISIWLGRIGLEWLCIGLEWL